MRIWYVVYKDDQKRHTLASEGDIDAAGFEQFAAAAKAGKYDGREVVGMWVIDDASEQGDVIKTAGRVDDEIRRRHEAYKQRLGDLT